MTDRELKEFAQNVRAAMPPLQRAELGRDLWPAFLQKTAAPRVRISWFDWALVALAAAALISFPGVIPALLYHL